MNIENIEETLNLLENIECFFTNFEDIEKKLSTALINKELERDDLLHEIELSRLNAVEIMNMHKRLEKVLKERRVIKDKIALMNTMKPYVNKFVEKGICAETKITIKNIKTLKSNNEVRQYVPRIIKDLKCAKK